MATPVTKEYLNFYENLKEAQMRLQNTVVMYDSAPYYVICLADYKPDGIIRVYMEPLGTARSSVLQQGMSVPYDAPSPELGVAMDQWMIKHPDKIIRKMMNSPAFNKFRPFDLGMCNSAGRTFYCERQPQRHTQQGLTQNMIFSNVIELAPSTSSPRSKVGLVNIQSLAFRDCILGNYPSFDECVKNLLDPDIENNAVAFHRQFALCRGPLDSLFLAYKNDVVGCLPYGDARLLRLSPRFAHVKEVTDDLRLFDDILIK